MRFARRIGKWFAVAAGSVFALVALIFGGLQTSAGKTLLASVASSLASSEDMKIEIAGIEGFVPSDMRVRSVRVSDARGPFAVVEGVHATWRPFALLRGVIDVESAGAARVAVLRKPESSSAAPAQPSGDGGLSVPAIRIGRLALDKIEIAEPVVGSAATLSLTASADLSAMPTGVSGSFALERFDAPGKISGKIDYAADRETLAIDITANEPAGGLISRTLAIDGLPPVTATVKGEGPLAAFDAHVDASAGDIARIGGAVQVRSAPRGHKIAFALEADASQLLPANLQPLFADISRLAGAAVVDETLRVDIETLSARTAGFTAVAKGAFDASRMTADIAYRLDLGRSAAFSGLAQGADWSSIDLEGTLKGALAAPAISAQARARDLSGAGYSARSLMLNASATPDARKNLSLVLRGVIEGLSARDAKVAAALGERAEFAVTGAKDFAGPPFINTFTARLHALAARFDGRASAQHVAGKLKIDNFEFAALSPLAGRTLSGSAALDAEVDASGDLSRAQMRVNATARNIATGIDAVDEIFGKSTNVSGRIARNEKDVVRVDQLRLSGNGLGLQADGAITRDKANLEAVLSLDNLALLDRRLSGAASAEAAFSGRLDDLGLKLRLSVPRGAAMRQPVEALTMDIDARDITGHAAATMSLAGRIAGKPASGKAAFATKADGAKRIDGLSLSVGSVNAKGDVALDANGLATGRVSIVAGNLADLSALALTELAGRLNADISLDADSGRQRVAVKADADDVRGAGHELNRARVDLAITDPAGAPMVSGAVQLAGMKAGGVEIPKAALNAEPKDGGASLQLNAVANGVAVTLAGHLSQRDRDALFRLNRLNLVRGGAQLTTARPANITLSGGAVAIDRLELSTKGGGASVSGRAGDTLDLQIDLRSLPLSLSELAAPGLGVGGTISGSANISGSPGAPNGAYKLSLAKISTSDLAKNGVGPLDITAEGQLRGGRVDTRTRISGRHLSDVIITGSAPIAAGDLDLAIKGGVDLAIANAALAASGARVSGRATIDATVKGPTASPRAGGSVRIAEGRFEDSVNGVTLNKIEALVTGTDRSVTLNSLAAATTNNGRITAHGSVSLDAAQGFPGKIDIDLVNAGLINSELMRMVAEGRVAIEGALANAPRLTGRLVVKSLDVNIPDRLPGGGSALEVRHVNAGGKTQPSAKPAAPPQRKASSNTGMPLDITVSAPNNVFVRGMGLTAELGGDIKITGSSGAPVTQGGFEMRRGDFEIIGKRLNFTRGKVSFSGSTDPDLDFVAETRASDVTAQILVTGPASKPSVTFASTPTLPQDEVLARLMFGRGAGSLTPGQALQIAQTVAQFSGGGPGVLEKMRRSLGVDSLNVGTDASGKGGQVGVGKRLNDRIYLGVRQGTTPNSGQVTIDVDITRNLRLQGATGADGSAEVGIGAQWDY